MTLTNDEHHLLRADTPEGRAFRAGAAAEARERNADTLLHRELLECARAFAEHHPEWESHQVAAALARIFSPPQQRDLPPVPRTDAAPVWDRYDLATVGLATDVWCRDCNTRIEVFGRTDREMGLICVPFRDLRPMLVEHDREDHGA